MAYFTSLAHSLLVLALVLLPFFLAGLHNLSDQEIIRPNHAIGLEADQTIRARDPVESQIDARWYPLFGPQGRHSAASDAGAFACFALPCVGLPLLIFLIARLALDWMHLSKTSRCLRLLGLLPAATTLFLVILWDKGITAWFMLDVLRHDY